MKEDKDNEKQKYLKWTLLPYFGSWMFGIILMFIASVITAIVRKITGTEIELIPDTLLDFIIEFNQIYIYVPVAWLLGDMGIKIMELAVEFRSGRKIRNKNTNLLESNMVKPDTNDNELYLAQKEFEESRGK